MDRGLLWDKLEVYIKQWGDKWIVGGDFNMILSSSERPGGGNFNGEVEEFREVVDRLNLVNLPLVGGKLTWSTSREMLS